MAKVETNGLFNEIDINAEQDTTTPVLVKMVTGSYRSGIDKRSGHPNASCFVRDNGQLPVLDEDDRQGLKNIVFAHKNFMAELINKTGYKDDQGDIWFWMPPVMPNTYKAYWIRSVDPYVIDHAQQEKEKQAQAEAEVKAQAKAQA